MATFEKGIVGGFSGKVGPIVGSSFRGLDVLKSKPKKSNKPPTPEQEMYRMRFGLTVRFLSPLKRIITRGYGNSEGTKSKLNQCISYHAQNALTGDFPDLAINFSKVILTKGELDGANNSTVSVSDAATVNFSWTDNSGLGLNKATDLVVMAVYIPSKERHALLIGPSDRASQSGTIVLPVDYPGETVHCWMAFVSADGKAASTSNYLGAFNFPL